MFESRKRHHLHLRHLPLKVAKTPEISLKEARDLRDDARSTLAKGIDPAEKKRRDKREARMSAENTFSAIAKLYIEKNRREGLVDATLRPYEAAKNDEKAHRTLQFVGQVFRFAIANQLAKTDPTRDLRGALSSRKPKHHAAMLEPKRVGELLRAIDGYLGQPITLLALQLSSYVFVRSGELRKAEWTEIDLEAAVWRIPASKMKGRQEHAVPLSTQAVALLRQAQEVTGDGKFVFPSLRSGANPMSENTVNAALRRLGFTGDEMTAHGFRAMASTLLNESGKWSPDAIERALAHKDKDIVRAAYHQGAHWQERVEMAQWWADYLDSWPDPLDKTRRAAAGWRAWFWRTSAARCLWPGWPATAPSPRGKAAACSKWSRSSTSSPTRQ